MEEIAALLGSSYTCPGISGFPHNEPWTLDNHDMVLAMIKTCGKINRPKQFLNVGVFLYLCCICIFAGSMTVESVKCIMRLQRQTGAECSRAKDFLMQSC